VIKYDRSLFKGLIISPTTWTASPFVRWFDDFRIISIRNEPKLSDAMRTVSISEYIRPDEEMPRTVRAIYKSEVLQRALAANDLLDYTHVLNRQSGEPIPAKRVLVNQPEIIAPYESKVAFRKHFSHKVKMPKYKIMQLSDWSQDTTYDELARLLSPDLVIQHPDQSGGRGTYFASSAESFNRIVNDIAHDEDHETPNIVVSERVANPVERSLQVCILEDAVLVGPPQAQLIRNAFLTYDGPDAIQFCGGSIGEGLMSDEQYAEASTYARTIAATLQYAGYRGIFGIDYLISNEVYVIEANLRFTGLSPLLASLQHEAPYMLLHVLEQAKQPYQLDTTPEKATSGSFITVYAKHSGQTDLETGLYDVNLLPSKKDLFFIATRTVPGVPVKAGKSLAFVYSLNELFDTHGELSKDAYEVAKNIRSRFIQD
jgi:hypothetical protein